MKTERYTDSELDSVFAALSDPTRRAILARLATGEATVTELADPFDISQPAISKHLKVLEKSGLIERKQDRQSRPAVLCAQPLHDAVGWMLRFRQFWGKSFDQLDELLAAMNDNKTD